MVAGNNKRTHLTWGDVPLFCWVCKQAIFPTYWPQNDSCFDSIEVWKAVSSHWVIVVNKMFFCTNRSRLPLGKKVTSTIDSLFFFFFFFVRINIRSPTVHPSVYWSYGCLRGTSTRNRDTHSLSIYTQSSTNKSQRGRKIHSIKDEICLRLLLTVKKNTQTPSKYCDTIHSELLSPSYCSRHARFTTSPYVL